MGRLAANALRAAPRWRCRWRSEERERADAFQFGVKFVPSVQLQLVAQLTWVPLRDLRQSATTMQPAQQLAWFGVAIDTPVLRALAKEREDAQARVEKEAKQRQDDARKREAESHEREQEEREQRARDHEQLLVARAKREIETRESAGLEVPDHLRREAAGDFRHLVGVGR